MDFENLYKIEIRGRYSADVHAADRDTAQMVVSTAKMRDDVSLIRVTKGDKRAVLAWEESGWIQSGTY